MPKIGMSQYWDETQQKWVSYYAAGIAAGIKDANFKKIVDGEEKAMTQGEINLQFRDEKQDYSGLHIVNNQLCMYAPAPTTTQSDNN